MHPYDTRKGTLLMGGSTLTLQASLKTNAHICRIEYLPPSHFITPASVLKRLRIGANLLKGEVRGRKKK